MTSLNSGTSAEVVCALVGVSRQYGSREQSVVALSEVSMSIYAGEFVAIAGPSGCGKSTLLSILGLLESPDCGQYIIAGQDVTEFGFDERATFRNQNIGLIFQSFNLISDLSVADNVSLPLKYAGVPTAERQSKARALLERVGLGARADSFPSQMSGGQQQRVAIARAMVTEPALILADEPTGNLDSENSAQVLSLLREFNRMGATIALVTHDSGSASFADRVIRLRDGRLDGPIG